MNPATGIYKRFIQAFSRWISRTTFIMRERHE